MCERDGLRDIRYEYGNQEKEHKDRDYENRNRAARIHPKATIH